MDTDKDADLTAAMRCGWEALERLWGEEILPFWYPRAIDEVAGGYRLGEDTGGKGCRRKRLASQAEVTWLFAHLARSPYGRELHLQAARHGYEFLRDRMWDEACGGFYAAVDAAGGRAARPEKSLIGQALALGALAEYAYVSGDRAAAGLACRLFELIECRAHDGHRGGYRGELSREWRLPPDRSGGQGAASVAGRGASLVLLEAVGRYYQVVRDSLAWERLVELVLLESSAARSVIRGHGEETAGMPGERVQGDCACRGAGLIWRLIETCRTVELPAGLLVDLCRSLFEETGRCRCDGGWGWSVECGPRQAAKQVREMDRQCREGEAPAEPHEGMLGSAGASPSRDLATDSAHLVRPGATWSRGESPELLLGALSLYRVTGEALYWEHSAWLLDGIVSVARGPHPGGQGGGAEEDARLRSGKNAPLWARPGSARALLSCLELLAGELPAQEDGAPGSEGSGPDEPRPQGTRSGSFPGHVPG